MNHLKSSELQRQSVIVRGTNRKCPQLFLKGAPEAVAARCANMPAAFEDELGSFLYYYHKIVVFKANIKSKKQN